jgi:hypothetical protein
MRGQVTDRGCKEHTLTRTVRLLSISALVYLTQVFDAHAHLYCKRIEQLPTVSDGRTLGLLEAYVKSLDTRPFQIRQLTSRFVMVLPDDENCKVSRCYYRLLDLKDGEIKETFSFHGTGVIWYVSSPAMVRIEYFQDYYESYSLETSPGTYIGVGLPRTAKAVHVEVVPAEEVKSLPKPCRTDSK